VSVTDIATNKVAVRSIPTMNMTTGASCSTDVRIVALKFTIKDEFE
jgi:hypothetical protein